MQEKSIHLTAFPACFTVLIMKRSMIALCMILVLCVPPLFAETGVPDADTVFLPPPPPETALIPVSAEGPGMNLVRIAAMVGTAGGVALIVWGLGDVATAFGQGSGAGEIHSGLALTISGSVLAALSSTIFSLLKAAASK